MEGNAAVAQDNNAIKERRNYARTILITAIAITVCYLHSQYVAMLFENDRNFSMLSTLEREMSFKSEMGFYYSYYKTVVEEQPYLAAINKLMYDKLVEYPMEVNAFNRFNIHPEVLLGSLYRYLRPWLNDTRSCIIVDRGERLEPVEACNGLAEPDVFYVNAVFQMAGLVLGFLFLYGTLLSNNLLGGLLAVGMYMANHRHSTRAMWAPAQREVWAQPALLLQMCLVTRQMRRPQTKLPTLMAIFLLNCFCLIFWQFTQFIFLSQTFIVFVMEQLRVIDLQTFCFFLHAHFCGLQMAVLLLQGNELLKSSLYASFFVILSFYCLFLSSFKLKIKTKRDLCLECFLVALRITGVVALSIWLKKSVGEFLKLEEDTVIWEILLSKFTDYKNFHTMLYTCSEVFDFMPVKTWWDLWDSTLLPITLLCVLNSCLKWVLAAKKTVELSKEDREDSRQNDAAASDSGEDSGIENVPERNRDNANPMAAKKEAEKRVPRRKSKEKLKKDSKFELMEFVKAFCVDAGVFYNICQMAAFGFMATLAMRLKLLFVPHMCLFSSLIMNENFESMKFVRPLTRKVIRYLFFGTLLATVSLKMMQTIEQETSHLGEFSDPPQEELLRWVASATGAGSVFAAPMPLASAVLLSTRRAVVNHPHYEHKEARERNYAVYKTYGRFFPEELYQELTALRVTHLIVDRHYCYGKSNKGCSFEQIWSVESARAGAGMEGRPRPCELLLTRRLDHFYALYENSRYTVFRLHDYSVRYMPRTFHT